MTSVRSTWRSPRRRGSCSPNWSESVPTIVAEALTEVGDPLETALRPGPNASVGEVVRAIARSLAPIEADSIPPTWLQKEQVSTFRRALAAIARHGGALIADPVGSGKTWIALAIAQALDSGGESVVVVPASLRGHWGRIGERLGIDLAIISHEAISRGRLPDHGHLVIVDESHRFREPTTRRYSYLAPWLVGRRILLLSATPVVNRLSDLAHQLLLAVRDDCLSGRGCPSLLEALSQGEAPPALGDLVLCRPRPRAAPLARREVLRVGLSPAEDGLLAGLDELKLSEDRAVAALIRTLFWRALASSPAALVGALSRYDRLLHHARLAGESGRLVNRGAIRALTGQDPEQLVLWQLVSAGDGPVELMLADRGPLERLLSDARMLLGTADAKCTALRAMVTDGEPSLVFTTSRDTLSWLRDHLADHGPAWVTGAASGIGRSRLARDDVLAWFRPDAALTQTVAGGGVRRPFLLLATDVAAEGLDLQLAGRVIHYDLPWTSVRLEQRDGRALRLGAVRDSVAILEFQPPEELERRLGQVRGLEVKRNLTIRAGLSQDGSWLYRWRSDLAAWGRGGMARPGMSVVEGSEPGWLFGLALDMAGRDGTPTRLPADLFWMGDDGEIISQPEPLSRRLQELVTRPWRAATDAERQQTIKVLTPVVGTRLRLVIGERWRGSRRPRDHRRVIRRLRRLAERAAKCRDAGLLARLDHALAWLDGGLSAGEAALLAGAAGLEPERLLHALEPLGWRRRRLENPIARLTGVVRVASFRE